MARIYGVGIVGVKNSGHFGMAAGYLLEAIDMGLGAMVFTNTPRSMPAWGGREGLLGTSPFAVGLPGRGGDHWVLDMSAAVVERVRLMFKMCDSPDLWIGKDTQGAEEGREHS